MANIEGEGLRSDREAISQEVQRLLEPFNPKNVALTEATNISADLNIDSVAVMDLLMGIEDKYNIVIPINLLSEIRTVGDLVVLVQKVIGRK